LIVAFWGNLELRDGIGKGRADARPFLIVYPWLHGACGEWGMSENDKPGKAWWVNWLIIAGTLVVISVLSQG